MKTLLYISAFCAIILAGSACNKDYLNRKPLGSFSDEDVWTDINLVQAYVNSKYEGLPNFNNNQPADGNALVQTVAVGAVSDEGFSKFNWFGENIITTGQLTPDQDVLDVWSQDYKYIRYCNIFFANIASVPVDVSGQALKTELMGEMHFIRGYLYLDLIMHYGGVPIIRNVYNLDDTTFSIPRDTYDDCVSFIAQEADSAAALLPARQDDNDFGRANSVAALSLKSRALLYDASPLNNTTNDLGKWQKAADAAKAVIDTGAAYGYALYQPSDYRRIFLDKQNPEVIFSWNQNNLPGTGIDLWCSPNSYNGWSVFEPSQSMVDQFEMANGKGITDPSSGYDPQNPYVGREPRFYADILYNGAPYRGDTVQVYTGGKDSPSGPQGWNATLTGYNWRKYMDETVDFNDYGGNQNWIIFRLAETYLNYAEAENALGNDAVAQQYVNLLRTRTCVNLPAVTETGAVLRNRIRHERMVELCFEAQRAFDVRRWMIADSTENAPCMGVSVVKNPNGTYIYSSQVVQQRSFPVYFYRWPINRGEMRSNPELVQNPGYN